MSELNTQQNLELEEKPTEQTINAKQIKKGQKQTGSFSYVLTALILFGFCFVCCLFVFQIVLKPVEVVGRSMQPTLNVSAKGNNWHLDTDLVYYYQTTNVSNGDIVILKEGLSRQDPKSKLIKRIIATEGQTITLKKSGNTYFESVSEYIPFEVYINGTLLKESYISTKQKPAFETSNPYNYEHHNTLLNELQTSGTYSITVPKGQVFVMGDNRCHSTDSRSFGTISVNDYVMGKVVLHVPFGKNLFQSIWGAIF